MYFNTHSMQTINMELLAKKAPAVFAEQPHERTSDRYLFIPTVKIVQGLVNNGWNIVSAVQSKGGKEHGKHALMLMRNNDEYSQWEVDGVKPMLKIENSHDARSSFRLTAALYRKVCANGLTVPDSMFAAPRIKHTTNIDRDTVEASFSIIKDFPALMENVEKMRNVKLSNDERLLLASSAARLIYEPEQIERTQEFFRDEKAVEKQLLGARRYGDKHEDLWTITNVIQENAIRGNVKMVGESGKAKYTRKVTSIDRDSKINQELLTLANEMARIKGAVA